MVPLRLGDNYPFDDWGKLLDATGTASPVLGRLPGSAHLIVINGRSYRLKDTACNNQLKELSVSNINQ